MKFHIPTMGRAAHPKGCTSLDWLPHDRCVLVCPRDEVPAYQVRYPDVMVIAGPSEKHIGLTRQWIVAYAGENHWQIDDDLRFRCLVSNDHVQHMTDVEKLVRDGIGMAGVGQQFLGSVFLRSGVLHKGKPAFRTMCINYEAMKDLDMADLPVYEDLAMNIHAAQRGGLAVHYGAVTQDWSSGKQGVGGCSAYRTGEVVRQCAERMVERYPGICTIVQTKNTAHGMDLGYAVRVAWRKL